MSPSSRQSTVLHILKTYPLLVLWRHTDASSIIVAADEAAKTAIVDLIELRIARGMCGKSYMLLTGEVAAVEAAIEKLRKQSKIEECSLTLPLLLIRMLRFATQSYNELCFNV